MKNYTQAPLPFQGQKRRFLKPFKEALNEFSSTATYVDLFGGSGLLSHTVKQMYPDAKVIWNDYDDFQERIDKVKETNQLLEELRPLLASEPKDKKVRMEVRQQLLNIVKNKKYVDYITLSSNILFSGKYMMNYEQLSKEAFYSAFK